jgi:hypothetical protein
MNRFPVNHYCDKSTDTLVLAAGVIAATGQGESRIG